MNRLRVLAVLALTCCLVFSSLHPVLAARYELESGGVPTMFGDLGGSITGSSTSSDLAVTIDFGELSPANTNQLVTVRIPIAMRSDSAYQVVVTQTGSVLADPNSVQFSDIGFGVQNLRPFGNKPTACGINSTIATPFNNNPSWSYTISGATGRAQYPSSLANIGASTTIISGPQLSRNFGASGKNDGWAFDVILAAKPQYYTPGDFRSITLTFTISPGLEFPCL